MKRNYFSVLKSIMLFMVLLIGCQEEEIKVGDKLKRTQEGKTQYQNNSTLAVNAVEDNAVYVFNGDGLYRVDSETFAVSQLPYTWDGTTAATISNGFLYAIQYGTLYKLQLSTNAIWDLGHYWDGVYLLTSDDAGNLYAIQGAILYRINSSGAWVELNTQCDWTSSTDMAFDSEYDWIYIWQYGSQWRVDRTNGDCGVSYGESPLGPLTIPTGLSYSNYHAYGITLDEGKIRRQYLQSAVYSELSGTEWLGSTDITLTPYPAPDTKFSLWIIKNSLVYKRDYYGTVTSVPGLTSAYKVVSKNGR